MIERLLAAERALATGDLDQAERLFGQVAGADDRNAMAVAGLASVAMRRGDADAARALAARALAIDPDEAAAARLLAVAPALPTLEGPAEAPQRGDLVPPAQRGDLVPPAQRGDLVPPAQRGGLVPPAQRGGLVRWLRRLIGRS